MDFTAVALRYSSYLSLLSGCALCVYELAYGAIAFLCSIAFAHIASVLRYDKHVADMEETLNIVMTLALQARDKCDACMTAVAGRPSDGAADGSLRAGTGTASPTD